MNTEIRSKMVKAMEFIMRNLNDESLFDIWLSLGVADGDIEYGDLSDDPVDDSYIESNNFDYLMWVFTAVMNKVSKNGGLYCDGVVSKLALDEMEVA